ncbi:Fic family protein [Chloroflexota bacterium]
MNEKQQSQLALSIGADIAKYEPKYQISNGIEKNLDGIERQRWILENLIIEPKYIGWLRRRAFIRSGHHTLRIEGNILTEEQVADVLENQEERTDNSQHKEDVRNWNNAMQFVDSLSPKTEIPINDLLIRHVHSLILGPNDKIHLPGDYRRGDARVRHPISRKPVYLGPNAGDVPDLVHQLGVWLTNDALQINPVIASAIAHLRLVEIHPFTDGNGRTARALTTLMLQRRGYSFNKLLALERYFDADLLKYCEAISDTVGECFEGGRDLIQWLEYFTHASYIEASIVSDDIVYLARYMQEWHKALSGKGYIERHRDILVYAIIRRGIRPRDVIKIGNVSAVTATEDLKRLEALKLLESSGQGRARIYRPTEDFWEKL